MVVGLFADKKLTATDMAVALSVRELHNENRGGCFATNEYIAKKVKRNHRHVRRSLSRLAKLGVLEMSSPSGARIITVKSGREGGGQKSTRGEGKKVPPNVGQKSTRLGGQKSTTRAKKGEQSKKALSRNAAGAALARERVGDETTSVEKGTPSMSLFPTDTTATNGTTTDEDKAHARRLYQIVKDKKLLGANEVRPSTWARYVTMLRVKQGVTDERISAALEWYSTNAGRKYVPEIFCGRALKEKFDKLERAMLRSREKGEGIVISSDAEKALKNVDGLGWPKGSKARLPAAVQLTVENRGKLVGRLAPLRDFYEKGKASEDRRVRIDSGRKFNIANAVLAALGLSPVAFASAWFRRVHGTVLHWDAWSGEFSGFVFDPANDYTKKWGQRVCQEFSGRPGDWGVIVE
jgi:hypothetical protein